MGWVFLGAVSLSFFCAALLDFMHYPLTLPSYVMLFTSAGFGAVIGKIASNSPLTAGKSEGRA